MREDKDRREIWEDERAVFPQQIGGKAESGKRRWEEYLGEGLPRE